MVDVKFSMFFDRKPVIDAIDKAERAGLSKMGAFVRQRAKTSIRKSKKPATPGNPPRSHAGQLRSLIFFGFDTSTRSVVVGPTLFNGGGNPTVPHLLEVGGTVKSWRGKTARYRAFPFMGPALQAELPKFPDVFANSVRGN